ncbi:MAG: regulatory protein RecX [Marinirhabdus sp.]
MQAHKTYTVEEAKKRMERYCAYQERCHKEVKAKLKHMRMIPEAADYIMSHLIQHGFLNETRFSQHFARGKFSVKKWGRHRIVRELKIRDISPHNIKIAMEEITGTEYTATFEALVKKRLEQLQNETSPQKKKKKLADYLLYRGWESNLVWGKIAALF